MKEIVFKDRVPTNPGRVILTPVAGRANTYDMVRADDPTEEGTPLNADTFNNFVNLINADIERAKEEAISAGLKCETGRYKGTGVYGSTNKSSLTFSAPPKLVIIMKALIYVGSIADSTVRIIPTLVMLNMGSSGYGFVTPGTNEQYNFVSGTNFSGNNVTWYSADTAEVQMNTTAWYYYVAFC